MHPTDTPTPPLPRALPAQQLRAINALSDSLRAQRLGTVTSHSTSRPHADMLRALGVVQVHPTGWGGSAPCDEEWAPRWMLLALSASRLRMPTADPSVHMLALRRAMGQPDFVAALNALLDAVPSLGAYSAVRDAWCAWMDRGCTP
jgi:hypothetical protein